VVFLANDCTGEPVETPEAIPIWTPADAVPYHEMWADDSHWLPLVLDGKCFRAWFLFENETMLTHRVEIVPEFEEMPPADLNAEAPRRGEF
jgi:8-oxo-dGTP diphosphatase